MSALLALLKQKSQDIAAKNKGRTAKIPDGTSRWRILGSWRPGEGQQFWHDFGQHYVKDSTGKTVAVYTCSDKTFGRPCAVCDAVAEGIKGATDDATAQLLAESKANGRVLLNALNLSPASEDPTKVHILELAPAVFDQIITIAQEWEEAGETIFGASGKDLLVTRTGTGKQTKYAVQVAAKSNPVKPEVAAKVNNLDDYVAQESAEAQSRALNSVRAISGLLTGPATGARPGLPSAARAGSMLDDEFGAAAASPRAARPVEFEDVPDLTVARPPAKAAAAAPAAEPAPWEEPAAAAPAPVAAKPAAAAATPAAAPASTGDADLDDLIASLG